MKYINKFLCLLFFSAALYGQAAATKKVSLMLDWFVNPDHGPIIIAKEKGYFKQQGLNVSIKEPADPSVPAKLIAAGKFDLAVSYQPSLTIDVAAGLPLVRASTLVATPLVSLIVLDNGKINTISDLRGKKLGAGSNSGSIRANVGTMLKQGGVKFSDLKLINVGWALSSSLASGKVDVIWGGLRNFEANQLRLEGFKVKQFFPEEMGVPLYDELIVVANKNSYDKKMINAFNKALEQGITYMVNHPQKAWQEFVKYSPGTLNNKLNKLAWKDTLTRFALRPGAADFERYNHYAKFLFDNKIIKRLPKAQNYVLSFE